MIQVLAGIVFKNFLYNILSILITNIAGLIVTIYVARILKPELFGIYSLAISITFLILTFADLGVNGTVTRYVADSLKMKDHALVRGYIRSLGLVKLLLSFLASLILFVVAIYSHMIFKKDLKVLEILTLYVIFFSLSAYIVSVFIGFNDFKPNFIRALVYESTRVVSILILVKILSVLGALLGFVIASFASFIVLTYMLIKSGYLLGVSKKINWHRVMRFIGYTTLASLTWTVFAYVDTIMIGMFLPAEFVGYYRAAFNIVGAIAGLISIPAVLYPVFVQLEGMDLKNAFNRAFKYSAILTFPIVIILIYLSDSIVIFVYGKDYIQASPALCILSLLLFRSSLGFWGAIFSAKEKPEYPVYVTFVGMIVNVILNYIMILRWGIIGASLATLLSNFMVWIALAYLSKKHFNIFFDLDLIIKPTIAGLSMYLGAQLNILIGILSYILVLFLVKGLTKDDIRYFVKVILSVVS